ncbi:MAG: HAD domain-containing protein [Chitinophagaceae bacterium]
MLLFLDIDGVMVPAKSWKGPKLLEDGFPAFSEKATDALRQIVSGNTTVMLTTSHKANYSIEEWRNIFLKRGINIDQLNSLAANINNVSRKEELIKWFDLNHFDGQFVIIDDDKSLNDLPDYLKKRLVLTNSLMGLTAEHVQIVHSLLDTDLFPA